MSFKIVEHPDARQSLDPTLIGRTYFSYDTLNEIYNLAKAFVNNNLVPEDSFLNENAIHGAILPWILTMQADEFKNITPFRNMIIFNQFNEQYDRSSRSNEPNLIGFNRVSRTGSVIPLALIQRITDGRL